MLLNGAKKHQRTTDEVFWDYLEACLPMTMVSPFAAEDLQIDIQRQTHAPERTSNLAGQCLQIESN